MLKMMLALLAMQVVSPQVDTIAESSVTAVRNEVIVPRQTLAGGQLQSLSTSSVADALKFFSGVQIKDYGGLGGQKTINVRSLGTQHTGVYIDGIRITNCQNGTVDLGKYSLANLIAWLEDEENDPNEYEYTEETLAVYNEALAAAKAVVDGDDYDAIEAALAALREAYYGLKTKGGSSELPDLPGNL